MPSDRSKNTPEFNALIAVRRGKKKMEKKSRKINQKKK